LERPGKLSFTVNCVVQATFSHGQDGVSTLQLGFDFSPDRDAQYIYGVVTAELPIAIIPQGSGHHTFRFPVSVMAHSKGTPNGSNTFISIQLMARKLSGYSIGINRTRMQAIVYQEV
jgi:hypothetical protein